MANQQWCVAFDGNEPPPRNSFESPEKAREYAEAIVLQCAKLEIPRTYKIYMREEIRSMSPWMEYK